MRTTAEKMRTVAVMRRNTLLRLRNFWYLVVRRCIIDSVDVPDRSIGILEFVFHVTQEAKFQKYVTGKGVGC